MEKNAIDNLISENKKLSLNKMALEQHLLEIIEKNVSLRMSIFLASDKIKELEQKINYKDGKNNE